MSFEHRRDWSRGGGGGPRPSSSSAGGPEGRGGRGRHPSHLKGRDIGLWYARKQGQKSKEPDRQQVTAAARIRRLLSASWARGSAPAAPPPGSPSSPSAPRPSPLDGPPAPGTVLRPWDVSLAAGGCKARVLLRWTLGPWSATVVWSVALSMHVHTPNLFVPPGGEGRMMVLATEPDKYCSQIRPGTRLRA